MPMRPRTRTLSVLRAALLPTVAALTLSACAQCGPSGGAARDTERAQQGAAVADEARRHRSGSASAARKWMIDSSAAQLASARERLAIGPAQAVAWQRYADSVGALLGDLLRPVSDGAPSRAGQIATESVVQRLDRRVDTARNRYAALEDVAAALHALYDVLDEEQRRIADRMLAGTVPPLYDGAAFAATDYSLDRESPAANSRAGDGPRRDRRPGPPPR